VTGPIPIEKDATNANTMAMDKATTCNLMIRMIDDRQANLEDYLGEDHAPHAD